MVVLISNNKDLVDQQDQYKVLVAMVAFKGLMEGATISNFMLSIAQLELTYESLRPKKIDVSIIVTLSEKSCQPWKQTNNCLEPKTFLLSK